MSTEYSCCGQFMTSVEIRGVYDGTCAYLCPICGVWRHRFPPGDRRRPAVEAAMPPIVTAHLDPRGDVA